MKIEDHFFFEKQARKDGYRFIAGGDEAGRGPWAGPVFAAFVILSEQHSIVGLDDSKKLTRKKRRELFAQIQNEAMAFAIGTASAREIDEHNILAATRLAFKRAFMSLQPLPDYVLLDYIKLPWLELPHQAFAKGESISASVAAASILAKEARDLHMEELDTKFPGYGFAAHKGYGTAAHQDALQRLGPCTEHRQSFKPIKKFSLVDKKYETLFDFAPE